MKIQAKHIKDAALHILRACGESETGAAVVAESMLHADMRGVTTHGTYMLTPIYKRAQACQLTMPTCVTVSSEKKAAVVLDGGDGLGAVAGMKAVNIALKKAADTGVATVLIKNTNNIGMLAHYTEAAARQGMIALMCCNAAAAMAPWGASERFMGTNPIAIAVYTGGDLLFSADMATSVAARGKIRKAARNHESIPIDWAMDETGSATTDPAAALNGCLLPIGGPKGSALAVMVDILSGVLSGSMFALDLRSFHEPEGPTGVGACLTVLDISAFMELSEFTSRMTGYISKMKKLRLAPGSTEILIPGELEQRREKESEISGVTLDDNAVKALNDLLEKTGANFRIPL